MTERNLKGSNRKKPKRLLYPCQIAQMDHSLVVVIVFSQLAPTIFLAGSFNFSFFSNPAINVDAQVPPAVFFYGSRKGQGVKFLAK